MQNRSKIRQGARVIHRHRTGRAVYQRVSELVFTPEGPKAILGWIDLGRMRTPIYLAPLDPERLRKSHGVKNTYYYDAITIDPRADEHLLPERRAVPR